MNKIVIILCVTIVSVMAVMPLKRGPPISKTRMSKLIEESKTNKQITYRLPHNTAPRVYIINFDPDFLGESFTFKGNSSTIFEVLQPTSTVILNKSSKISIDEKYTELIDENQESIKPESQVFHTRNDSYAIHFPKILELGNYTLKMKWTGHDAAEDWFDQRMGFFRAYDRVKNYRPSFLVSTHFEPAGARSAFPCWDEPFFKAQFEISVTHFPNYTALSNMPAMSHQELPDGRVKTQFARSILMSSYLLCVVVSDYKHITNAHGNITFYGLESNLESLRYALEVSEKVIPAMEAYTGIPYALPKLDQITIPQYSGAMEHWGLINYKTKLILLENSTLIPNAEQRKNILHIVAHEVAHQWFGNLVSPVWWDDTWLNEAFAAYFQSRIVDQIYPRWHIMDNFVIEGVSQESYEVESMLPVARPIKWSPEGRIAFRMTFNAVTYRKGAAVVHMLEHILTEDVFREGLQRYLKKNQFTAVVTDDLWKSLQEVYDEHFGDKPLNIKETMDPWLEQTGTPVVTVARNYETGGTNLTQKNSRIVNPENKWRIPINYATKSNPDFSRTTPTMWMEVDQEEIIIPDVEADDWIIVNIQQRGFYQVMYDKENWKRIAEYLNSEDYSKIHVVNRAQLVDDIFKLYTKDESYLETLVNITSYLHRETDYLPWIPAANIILEMFENVEKTLKEKSFGTYMFYLTNAIINKLGFESHEGDNHSAIRIRSFLATILCSFGHAECRSFAHRLFDKFMENPSKNALPSSDWEWIVCNGLRMSNETLKDKFINSGLNHDPDGLSPLTILIKCSDDFKWKEEYLNALINANSTTDGEDIDIMFNDLLAMRLDDLNFVLNYFIDHFKDIKEFYDKIEDDEYLSSLNQIALAIRTEEQHEKFKDFIESIIANLPEKSNDHVSVLRSSIKKSLNSMNQSKLRSEKFHELMDKNFFGPNVIEAGKGLKNN